MPIDSLTPLHAKSSTATIRARFDADVERFADLDTAQASAVDAPLMLALITHAAARTSAPIRRVLDVGCGAGNATLKLRHVCGADFDADLLDLSRPMLDRAAQRVGEASGGRIRTHEGDLRDVPLEDDAYDVVLAAAVLHHLRDDADWRAAFAKLYRITAPGGSVWITDLVAHETAPVQALMTERYGAYLAEQGGEAYRDHVFAYIDREDSPRPVPYQLDLLRDVGFAHVELLHKSSCFAAFGAVKRAA